MCIFIRLQSTLYLNQIADDRILGFLLRKLIAGQRWSWEGEDFEFLAKY